VRQSERAWHDRSSPIERIWLNPLQSCSTLRCRFFSVRASEQAKIIFHACLVWMNPFSDLRALDVEYWTGTTARRARRFWQRVAGKMPLICLLTEKI